MTPGSFSIIPDALRDASISTTAKVLYWLLIGYLNRRTGRCNPKRATLAKRLRVSESTVTRSMRELRRAGWVQSKRGLHGWNHRPREAPVTIGDAYESGGNDAYENGAGDAYETRPQSAPKTRCDAYESPTPDASGRAFDAYGNGAGDACASVTGDAYTEPHFSFNQIEPVADAAGFSPKPSAAAADGLEKRNGENAKTPQMAALAEELVAELLAQHPEPGNPDKAVAQAAAVLVKSADPEATAETIRQNHTVWREHWATLNPRRFRPQLWRWFASNEWKFAPAERKCATWETRRESVRLADERFYLNLAENEMWDQLRDDYGQDPEVWRAKVKTAG